MVAERRRGSNRRVSARPGRRHRITGRRWRSGCRSTATARAVKRAGRQTCCPPRTPPGPAWQPSHPARRLSRSFAYRARRLSRRRDVPGDRSRAPAHEATDRARLRLELAPGSMTSGTIRASGCPARHRSQRYPDAQRRLQQPSRSRGDGFVAIPACKLDVETAHLRVHEQLEAWIRWLKLFAYALDLGIQLVPLGRTCVGRDLFLRPAPAFGKLTAAAKVGSQGKELAACAFDARQASRARSPAGTTVASSIHAHQMQRGPDERGLGTQRLRVAGCRVIPA